MSRSLTRRESGLAFKEFCRYLADLALTDNESGPQSGWKVALNDGLGEISNLTLQLGLALAHLLQFSASIVQGFEYGALEIVENVLDRPGAHDLILQTTQQLSFEGLPDNPHVVLTNGVTATGILRP